MPVDAAKQVLLVIAIRSLTIMNNLRLRGERERLHPDVAFALADIQEDLERVANQVTLPEEFPDLVNLMEQE